MRDKSLHREPLVRLLYEPRFEIPTEPFNENDVEALKSNQVFRIWVAGVNRVISRLRRVNPTYKSAEELKERLLMAKGLERSLTSLEQVIERGGWPVAFEQETTKE